MEEVNKGLEVVTVLKKLMDTVNRNVHRHFKEINVTAPQGILIHSLYRFGQMKIGDLSEKLGLSNSTVSGIIDRLEAQGLLERTRSIEDRRVVYVNITPAFKKDLEAHFQKIDKIIGNIVSKATEEELDDIFKGLHTLQRVFDRNNG